MATLPTYFRDFLTEIRPTRNQQDDMKTGHETLRKRLAEFEPLQDVVVSDFIQGSYRRSTAIRPVGDKKSDVDVIVVTNLDEETVKPQDPTSPGVPATSACAPTSARCAGTASPTSPSTPHSASPGTPTVPVAGLSWRPAASCCPRGTPSSSRTSGSARAAVWRSPRRRPGLPLGRTARLTADS